MNPRIGFAEAPREAGRRPRGTTAEGSIMTAKGRKTSRFVRSIAVATAAFWAAGSAGAQSGVEEIDVGCDDQGLRCRELSAAFDLPGGRSGRIRLSFEDATRLNGESFDVQAELVDPRDREVTSRLPRDTFVPGDFPVKLTVEPRRGGGLTFRRHWTLELTSDNLDFSSHTPYRLFRARPGGQFEDISFSLGSGSFRVRGAGGRFSEFLIVADMRPAARVIAAKLARLRLVLESVGGDIGTAADALGRRLDQAQEALAEGDLPQAIARIDDFLALVEARSGTDIPDDTRPDDDVEGVAARLLAGGLTLRHAIFLGLESAQGGMSGFSRRLTVGGHDVRVDLAFSEAFVARRESFEIEGEIVDADDPALLGRLPGGVRVPEEFPVLLRIGPRPGARQTFRGAFEVELRTGSLDFVGGTALRLFKAPDGGAFEDITRTYGLGSFRVRGAGGRFSEFLIVEDTRPIASILARKLESAAEVIEANAGEIPAAVRADLEAALGEIGESIEQGNFRQAIARAEAVVEAIGQASGDDIPALWRSDEPLANVAGEMISLLSTLVFSLELRDQPTAAPSGDVNGDGVVDIIDVFALINQVFGGEPPPAPLLSPSADDER